MVENPINTEDGGRSLEDHGGRSRRTFRNFAIPRSITHFRWSAFQKWALMAGKCYHLGKHMIQQTPWTTKSWCPMKSILLGHSGGPTLVQCACLSPGNEERKDSMKWIKNELNRCALNFLDWSNLAHNKFHECNRSFFVSHNLDQFGLVFQDIAGPNCRLQVSQVR